MTVAQAREKAGALIPTLRASARELEARITLEDLVDKYTDSRVGLRKPEWLRKEYRRSWACWAARHIGSITAAEVSVRHAAIANSRGPSAGVQAVTALRTVFNYAVNMEMAIRNPAKAVKTATVLPRSRYLSREELLRLGEALDGPATPEWLRHYIGLLLFTGARRRNVASMRWDEVTGDVWVVPAEKSKNKRAMDIVLIPQAVDILNSRAGNGSEYVFPGRDGGWRTNTQRQWEALRVRAGLEDIVLHDCRRTHAVMLIQSGASLPVVQKALGHANPATTARVYALAPPATVRGAVEKAFSGL